MRLVSMTCCTMQVCTQDAGEVTFDTYKERQMHYAGMKRPISLYIVTMCYGVFFVITPRPGSARQLQNPEENGVPDEISKAWKQAVSANSRSQKNALFKAFLKAGKSWGRFLGVLSLMWFFVIHCLINLLFFFQFMVLKFQNFLRLKIEVSKSRVDRTIANKRYGPNLSHQSPSTSHEKLSCCFGLLPRR